LIPPNERAAFREMLEHELRGRELPDGELRRVAEGAWHNFLRCGWPKHGPGDAKRIQYAALLGFLKANVGTPRAPATKRKI
jgi:hypothetical protein